MSNAVSRPGIDPRVWITKATVEELGFDANEGIFADVALDDGTHETCLLGTQFSTDGGGLYCPVSVGDIVLVAIPDGEPDYGPTVICQLWSKKRRPAPEMGVGDTPAGDVIWRTAKGRKLRILTTDGEIALLTDGSGNITITSTSSGVIQVSATNSKVQVTSPDVELGNANPTDPVARAPATATFLQGLQTAQENVIKALEVYTAAIQSVADPSNLVTPTLKTALDAITATVSALSAAQVPSTTTKTT